MKRFAALALMCLGIVSAVRAQPLADRVPEDAIVYVGWRGAETPDPLYADSRLRAILDESRVRELFGEYLDNATELLANFDDDISDGLNMAREIVGPMWKYPTAVVLADVVVDREVDVPVKAFIVCKAGAESAKLKEQIESLGDLPDEVRLFTLGDMVCLAIGYGRTEMALAGTEASRPKPLSANATFKSAFAKVQSDPWLISYVNIERGLSIANKAVTLHGDDEIKERFPALMEKIGVSSLKRVVFTTGFDGRDWMTEEFVEAPAPRTGLIATLAGNKLSHELLRAVPADATFMCTAEFDPAALLEAIPGIADAIEPGASEQVEQGLQQIQEMLGVDLRAEVFEPLGPSWAVYCSPTVGSNSILGLVLVNKLDDPAKAKAGLTKLSERAIAMAAQIMQDQGAPIQINGHVARIGENDVYYLGLPVVAPSWTIKGDYLYLSLFPQNAGVAARRDLSKPGIESSDAYKSLLARLKVESPSAVSFYDLPKTAGTGSSHATLMLLTRYAGLGDLFGLTLPEPLMPPLDTVLAQLTPAGSATWVDDAGFHYRSVTPFPGAIMYSEPGVVQGVVGPALAAAVALPALNNAREQANRTKSMSNLKQIGLGVIMFANDNNGVLPANFDALEKYINNDVIYDSPLGDAWDGPDYVYLIEKPFPMAKIESMSEFVIAYDAAAMENTGGAALLFADGHVEWRSWWEANQAIDATKEKIAEIVAP